jgi:hypothetical protein
MSLASQLVKLSNTQMQSLYSTLLDVGLAFESGSYWREILRNKKNTHYGLQGRVYAMLYKATHDEIDNLARKLTEKIF